MSFLTIILLLGFWEAGEVSPYVTAAAAEADTPPVVIEPSWFFIDEDAIEFVP